jgi:hypothetical protein
MNRHQGGRGIFPLAVFTFLLGVFFGASANAADTDAVLSANELANRLSTLQQDGSSYIRLRLVVMPSSGAPSTTLQIQLVQRRTKNSTDVIYQILWPKDRKGESVLLRKSGNRPATGSHFVPPGTMHPLDSSMMKDPLFGSDLSYADSIENFFAWDSQKIVGEERVGRVNCQILESKPGKGQHSIYSSVRSWVDTNRLVPLRVEKFFSQGQPTRRIETTRVSKEDDGRYIPASLRIRGPRNESVTDLEGSRLDTRVTYEERDFTPEALKELKRPKAPSSSQ